MKTIIGSLFVATAILAAPAAGADDNTDPFDQRHFPCDEDQVLAYAPQFGPDRVGCIYVSELGR